MSAYPRFLPIVGYEGFYEVGDTGLIRSLTRKVAHRGRGGVQRTITIKGRILTPVCGNGDGKYLAVRLCRDGVVTSYLIHRLVAQAFVSGSGPHVLHINHDTTDNRAQNLMWGTAKENIGHCVEARRHAHGEKATYSKLTEQDVVKIRDMKKTGATYRKIASVFCISPQHACDICLGKRWTHVSH